MGVYLYKYKIKIVVQEYIFVVDISFIFFGWIQLYSGTLMFTYTLVHIHCNPYVHVVVAQLDNKIKDYLHFSFVQHNKYYSLKDAINNIRVTPFYTHSFYFLSFKYRYFLQQFDHKNLQSKFFPYILTLGYRIIVCFRHMFRQVCGYDRRTGDVNRVEVIRSRI